MFDDTDKNLEKMRNMQSQLFIFHMLNYCIKGLEKEADYKL